MFQPAPWSKKHSQKFVQLMDTFSEEYSADVVLGCEVGGHLQGMDEGLLKNLELPNLTITRTQNYMTALNQKQLTIQYLWEPIVTQLAGTNALETQLVLTAVHETPMRHRYRYQ